MVFRTGKHGKVYNTDKSIPQIEQKDNLKLTQDIGYDHLIQQIEQPEKKELTLDELIKKRMGGKGGIKRKGDRQLSNLGMDKPAEHNQQQFNGRGKIVCKPKGNCPCSFCKTNKNSYQNISRFIYGRNSGRDFKDEGFTF